MTHAPRKKVSKWLFWGGASVAALVIVAGIWVVQMLFAQPTSAPQPTEEQAMPNATTRIDDTIQPHLLDTSDALARYVTAAQTDQLHYPEDIDWSEQFVVALPFSTLQARSFTAASIEKIDGVDSYVIDLVDPPKGCLVPQVQSDRIAFVAQDSRDTNLPVIIRATPNTASCNDLQ